MKITLKDKDICPVCGKGVLEYVHADDPNDIHPNGGWDECLICERCGHQIEIKNGLFIYEK
jgi:rRNA maturation endonuclease Nob1